MESSFTQTVKIGHYKKIWQTVLIKHKVLSDNSIDEQIECTQWGPLNLSIFPTAVLPNPCVGLTHCDNSLKISHNKFYTNPKMLFHLHSMRSPISPVDSCTKL